MTKNKTILAAILLLALIPLTADASITRVIGMGGEGAAFIIRDAYTPNIWPQLVLDYKRIAGAEFGSFVSGYASDYTPLNSWGFTKAYVNYDMGEDKCAFQFSLDKVASPKYMMGPDRLLTVEGAYNKLSFIFGKPLGDVKVGLGINYTGKSHEKDDETATSKDQFEASYSTFGARLGLTALENNLDLAFGVEFASFSDDGQMGMITMGDTSSNTYKWENDGSMSMAFAGRYWYHPNDQYALIPNIKFSMMKDAGKGDSKYAWRDDPDYFYDDETNAEGNTITEFAFGLGNNWKPVENMLAIFELGVFSQTNKFEESFTGETREIHGSNTLTEDTSYSKEFTNSQFNLYWRLGFETKIFEWMNGRFGAERTWKSFTKEWTVDLDGYPVEASGKPKYGSAITSTYLGATVHWNRLYLDMLVEPMFMNNGPYFISGQDTDLFSRVSLWYKFKD